MNCGVRENGVSIAKGNEKEKKMQETKKTHEKETQKFIYISSLINWLSLLILRIEI